MGVERLVGGPAITCARGRWAITVSRSLAAGAPSMRWILLALLISSVATCGQKGPLHLPEDGPEGAAGANAAAGGGGPATLPRP